MMEQQLIQDTTANADDRSAKSPSRVHGALDVGHPKLAETDDSGLAFEDEIPCGSMALGKKRNDDQPIDIEPEKHLTPRASSKEFPFPKSN